jgi:predicted protein tyrosine phosphatase
MILVCPLSKVAELMTLHNPKRVVSLLDPGSAFPELGPSYMGRHLRLQFHDVNFPLESQVPPETTHVDHLLHFLNRWDPADTLLIHCRAGISRSTATAFIAACFHNPNADEREIAAGLRRAAPLARPNETLIRLADRAMERSGRMSEAIASTGQNLSSWVGVDEAHPFEMPSMYSQTRKIL